MLAHVVYTKNANLALHEPHIVKCHRLYLIYSLPSCIVFPEWNLDMNHTFFLAARGSGRDDKHARAQTTRAMSIGVRPLSWVTSSRYTLISKALRHINKNHYQTLARRGRAESFFCDFDLVSVICLFMTLTAARLCGDRPVRRVVFLFLKPAKIRC
ncbi:hypothetical protein BX600DRAFT_446510 [Xylariales sp. PMI_506]|nr:hypothetical protein BX600DRAFT_446510 [Xylariales sp. PMI_506]